MSGFRRFAARREAMAGLAALLVLILLSLAAPALAPQDPTDPLGFDPLDAGRSPALTWTFLLGADDRGRSVLALLLWGGRMSLAIGLGAALLAAAVGLPLGAAAARWGEVDRAVTVLMDLCQAPPPLLVALMLSARLGGLAPVLLLGVLAASGWVAPARLTRAAVAAGLRAPSIEAARALGVSEMRLLRVHLLPGAARGVVALAAAGAASNLALAAGLDFMGLGVPPGSVSWGTALAGAEDALAAGNWWWLAAGGLALAMAVLSLHAIALGIGRAGDAGRHGTWAAGSDPGPERLRCFVEAGSPSAQEEDAPVYPEPWARWAGRATTSGGAGRPHPWPRAAVLLAAMVLGAALLGQVRRQGGGAPEAPPLIARALAYTRPDGRAPSYIATATYAATEAAVAGRQLPWAAWAACPPALGRGRCAHADVQIWYSAGQARALSEGMSFVCAVDRTWGFNPMAGMATEERGGCGPLGVSPAGLGATAGVVAALLPSMWPSGAHVLGEDLAAGRRCWMLALGRDGRACVDAATGLALRLERLDHAGQPMAEFRVTAVSFGLDLAPELFADPIPGGRAGLLDSLSQPLLNIQAADDQALFSALVPSVLPAGLRAETPTFDSFYDDRRGYALAQRVRQVYMDGRGRTVLVLVETLPGSAWDVTPPTRPARMVVSGGRRVMIWVGGHGQPGLARILYAGTAALVSSPLYGPDVLGRVALGMQ